MWKIFATVFWCIELLVESEATVLDPALYLAPSPPLKPINGAPQGEFWSQSRIERNADLTVLPIEDSKTTTNEPPDPQETMDQSETFWPFVARYRTGGIHVPVTYSLTGSYGHGAPSSGVIGSSYVSVAQDGAVNQYGNSGLAGSSYGRYGTRIFGGSSGPVWSGWGNGKWGHYGKGK